MMKMKQNQKYSADDLIKRLKDCEIGNNYEWGGRISSKEFQVYGTEIPLNNHEHIMVIASYHKHRFKQRLIFNPYFSYYAIFNNGRCDELPYYFNNSESKKIYKKMEVLFDSNKTV